MDDWAAFQEAASRPEPTVFRIRRGRIDADELLDRLARRGFRARPVEGLADFHQVTAEPYPLSFTPEHWLGLLYVQQASTGVAAPALDPRPGERVLDLCSAPGGKTTHAAELMEDRGCLVASDVSESRIRGLLGNVYRLGHTGIMTTAGDGRRFPSGARFDRVLVDAPCSGEGTLRRRGGRAPMQSHSFLGYVTRAQEGLLRRAIELTRPGGRVLYVTCTFAPEENEAVVSRVLADTDVDVEPLRLGVPHAPGLTRFGEERYDERLEGAARIYPHHLDSGGLFLACLRVGGGADGDRGAVEGPGAEAAGAARDGGEDAGAWSPVPAVFPGEDLGEDEARERVQAAAAELAERFGAGAEAWQGCGCILRGGRLWLHSLDAWPLEAWAEGPDWRPVSVGFRAVEFDSRGRVRPSNDLLQWLGARVRAGVVDVDDALLPRLLAGETAPVPPGAGDVPWGPVALRWRGEILGRGSAGRAGVRSEIPRARAADLRQVLERLSGGA